MARVLCSWALYLGFYAVSLAVAVIKAGQILGKKRAGSSRGWGNAAEHPLQLVAWRGCAAWGPLAAVGFEMENHGGGVAFCRVFAMVKKWMNFWTPT